MTILEKVKKYYQINAEELETFLEKTTFLDTNPKYPKSVVIKFGIEKLVGEIAVWELETEAYMECEYVNLIEPDLEPITFVKTINTETIIESLKTEFNQLYTIRKNSNYD